MYSKSSSDSLVAGDCHNNNCCLKIMKRMSNMDRTSKEATSSWNQPTKRSTAIDIRREEVLAIRTRFPSKIPVIVQRFSKEVLLPQLDKTKFLVPQDLTMSQFQGIIRNRIHLHSAQSFYLLVDNRSMVSLSLTLSEVYNAFGNSDGFLYITYTSQDVFGKNVKD